MAPASFYDPSTAEYFDPSSKRRVAIVTGGNSGIGWFTALHLYLHGYIVYVAGRSEHKVKKAIEEIETEAKTRAEAYPEDVKSSRHFGTLTYLHLDLCDLASAVSCAELFSKNESKLHILINNAGIMAAPYLETKDGIEIQYQVNYVAPFLFTFSLLPYLKNAEVDQPPRVITLSSVGHNMAMKRYDHSDKMKRSPNFLFTWLRYGRAKSADIQFMKKFAELYPDMIAFSVHPGVIVDTELYQHMTLGALLGGLAKLSLKPVNKLIGVSSEEGCLATLRAALDQSLGAADSGAYFETGGVIGKPSKIALSKANIELLWDQTTADLEKKGFPIHT